MRRFWLREPVFNSETLVVTECSELDFAALLAKRGEVIAKDEGAAGKLFRFGPPDWWALWMEEPDEDTLGHELFHLTVQICDAKGIPITVSTDETAAYLFEYLMRESRKRLKIR